MSRGWLPRGLEWKARILSELNARLLDRAKFVNFALRSVEDGLLIADPDGLITFANRSAGRDSGRARARPGGAESDPAPVRIGGRGNSRQRGGANAATSNARSPSAGCAPLQYTLRLAAVSADEKGEGPVLGIVASLSDVTRQYELQQTKNDVISLVSHEMRTPLTAIQGMTELLAAYDVEPVRRREMNLAINDEVKRLTRMITDYLDITRLESGATAMRLSPVRAESLLERILILLEPVAAQRHIRLVRNFPDGSAARSSPIPICSRARWRIWFRTRSSTAPTATVVTVSARAEEEYVAIEVADHGYGIPEADLERVFEKFYRVPRVQDAGCARHRARPGAGSRNRGTASRLRLRAKRSQPGFHLYPADPPQ